MTYPTQFHVSNRLLTTPLALDIRPSDINKPNGGLWTSSYTDKKSLSAWVKYCEDNNFRIGQRNNMMYYVYADHARIYTIDTKQDALDLFAMYPRVIELTGTDYSLKYFDFVEMKQHYDALHVTWAGIWSNPQVSAFELNLSEWGVESTVWLNNAFMIARY